jgi:HEAT repeat protein
VVESLLARLDDVMLGVREAAVGALGRLKNERAVEPLLALLRSGGRSLHKVAARALGRIGDSHGLTELRHLLESTVRETRLAALDGLSQTCEDEINRKLVSRDVDGLRPFLDCNQPIGDLQVRRAVRKIKLSEEEVRRRYEDLAERFPLKLAWRGG